MTDLFTKSTACLTCQHWKEGTAYPTGRFCANAKSTEFLRATKPDEACEQWEEQA